MLDPSYVLLADNINCFKLYAECVYTNPQILNEPKQINSRFIFHRKIKGINQPIINLDLDGKSKQEYSLNKCLFADVPLNCVIIKSSEPLLSIEILFNNTISEKKCIENYSYIVPYQHNYEIMDNTYYIQYIPIQPLSISDIKPNFYSNNNRCMFSDNYQFKITRQEQNKSTDSTKIDKMDLDIYLISCPNVSYAQGSIYYNMQNSPSHLHIFEIEDTLKNNSIDNYVISLD
jgi:hypothetical protein